MSRSTSVSRGVRPPSGLTVEDATGSSSCGCSSSAAWNAPARPSANSAPNSRKLAAADSASCAADARRPCGQASGQAPDVRRPPHSERRPARRDRSRLRAAVAPRYDRPAPPRRRQRNRYNWRAVALCRALWRCVSVLRARRLRPPPNFLSMPAQKSAPSDLARAFRQILYRQTPQIALGQLDCGNWIALVQRKH